MGELKRGGTAVVSDGADLTTDGAATRHFCAGMTGRLAVALLAALALLAFQFAHAQSSSAATGVPCPQTGNELVATDQPSYDPGSVVHVSGMGYAPGCDVVVKVTRPDGSVVSGDGSFAPGSDTVTTDLFGGFNYDYQLQAIPPLEGTYVIEVLGLRDALLARMTFHDANNDANIAPEWAPGNTVTTFNTLYRVTAGGTVQHVRVTLPVGFTAISAGATAFSSGTWSAPVVTGQSVDVSLTSGTGLVVGGWARIDVTATTPTSLSNNPAKWMMQTITNTAGTTGEQNDTPPVLVNDPTTPSATITFVDVGGNPISQPVLQNNQSATVRVRFTASAANGIKYLDVAVPTCFTSPTGVTTTASGGGNGGYTSTVTDGFIRMPGGSIPASTSLTVQFTTTPQCVSGVYTVSASPSTKATNPPSTTNSSVQTTGGPLTVAAGPPPAPLHLSQTSATRGRSAPR